MLSPPEPGDGEDTVHAFFKELNRLQEVSRQRAGELQRVKQAEEALQKLMEATLSDMQTERQATLQVQLEQVNAEIRIKDSRCQASKSKALMEEADRQLIDTRQLLEMYEREDTVASGNAEPRVLTNLSADPLNASLRCVSQSARLREKYMSPMFQLISQLHMHYQCLNGDTSPWNPEEVHSPPGFIDWLSTLQSGITFTDDERVALQFARRAECE
ncbi:hypothetical protein ABL78_5211 [Leptomonas seymouri]|uniref:Uncharacterized protein n=1 Tax=Leptomonas seymouri TaxID=5684 RepID=A0A0N1IJI0_LEPSE|nr:hypothetical protein ABL78_5211 [Leptomonas seymouri]|eukprot:KPI85724.1 hypothetical protein ABL78_5211 [Leptomonas seymouri]